MASVEPSSTTISSRSVSVWASTLAIAREIQAAPSRTPIRTDTAGAATIVPRDPRRASTASTAAQ